MMSTTEELLMRRGVQVLAVQENNPTVTPFMKELRKARAQVDTSPIGIGNGKPFTTIQLELAEARGWVEVAMSAHPARAIEFAVVVGLITAAEYTDSAYWLIRCAGVATARLDDLIKQLIAEKRTA
jgi:uncharacterized radical SAM superfamily protein